MIGIVKFYYLECDLCSTRGRGLWETEAKAKNMGREDGWEVLGRTTCALCRRAEESAAEVARLDAINQ